MQAGHIGSNVQRKTGFAHTGAGRQNNQVRTAKAGQDIIQIVEACGDTGKFIAVRTGQLLHGINNFQDRLLNGFNAGAILAVADIVQLLLGAFQQQGRIGFLAGLLQDIAGCFDQTAGLIFFLDDLDVRIDVGNRRDGFRNAGNVHFGIICALEHTVLSQRVHQSDNVHRFAFAEQAAHFLIDGPVLLRIEHIGVHLGDQAVQDGFIHQRCAKHALFRLHVIRQLNAQAGQA